MAKWSGKRQRAVRRRPDGSFKAWPGGRTKASLPKKTNNYQGIAAHIGALFTAEHGRPAVTGDLHRTRTKTGAYHKQAAWYVKTPNGWRKSPTLTRRPTPAEVRALVLGSRAGRPTKGRKRR